MKTIRLTMAQALVRYLAAQRIRTASGSEPLFHGVFAIFGHGNVAGLGEALAAHRERLPTFRAHNEQAMAHAAVAFAKAHRRRRLMACTTSVGPGATNMVTAAALAHVNRLPVLLLPGDVFAGRQPDPVLQQVEDFGDATVSANDCFRPVSRFFDRITRPEQILASLPHALAVLLDPADCGPVTLALPQDVQAEAFDFPAAFFAERVHAIERPRADRAVARANGMAFKIDAAPLRGGTQRGSPLKVIRPTASPCFTATWLASSTASIAASKCERAPSTARRRWLQSSRKTTRWSRSSWYSREIGLRVRAVAFQSIWRSASPARYSRSWWKSRPSPRRGRFFTPSCAVRWSAASSW